MFRNLLARILNDSPDAPVLARDDAELAIAALMIRVARSDDRYAAAEQQRIDHILSRRGGAATAAEPGERRAAAEMIEAEAPDTVRLTRALKERVPLEDRVAVVTSLWEVVYADGRRTADEDAMVRLICGLIGVGDVESNLARQRVLDAMGASG